MTSAFSKRPNRLGVFGPEIVLNVTSGRACLRVDDSLVAPLPDSPTTNAFVVWVGRPVIVVSEGVRPSDAEIVASRLREFVEIDDAPVVFSCGRSGEVARIMSAYAPSNLGRELARAEVYVLVQCAWTEAEFVSVNVDGQVFVFRVEFVRQQDGSFFPLISDAADVQQGS